MKTLNFSTTINAPAKKVWDMMLEPESYKIWTSAFAEGSTYKGSWEKGAKIQFIDPKSGDGMYSEIADNRPYEYISIKHLGMLKNGQPDHESEEAKNWKDGYENYTLTEENGKTKLDIEMIMEPHPEYEAMFSEMWPKALAILQELAEKFITVETTVNAPVEKVWNAFTEPQHITKWAFASDDWEAPAAENDLRVGGKFKTTMAAKDGSTSFDFTGTYTHVEPNKYFAYDMDDGRKVHVFFEDRGDGTTHVTEIFEMEHTNSEELQQSGWQSILDNFKKYVEGL